MTAEPAWVRFGDGPELLRARGITIEGNNVIVVVYGPSRHAPNLDAAAMLGFAQRPAGYYFQSGNFVQTRLIEEASEPTEAGWARMRERAFEEMRRWEEREGRNVVEELDRIAEHQRALHEQHRRGFPAEDN